MKISVLTESEIADLARYLTYADKNGKAVRFSVSSYGLKIKVGSGMWSAPMGETDPYSDEAIASNMIANRTEARQAHREGRHGDETLGNLQYWAVVCPTCKDILRFK
jgi:hypothetical protein